MAKGSAAMATAMMAMTAMTAMTAMAAALTAATACGGGQPAGSPAPISSATPSAPATLRAYALHFEGARIGTATEEEALTDDGVLQLRRRERVRFLRDNELATFEVDLRLRGTISDGATRVEAELRHCVQPAPARLQPPTPPLQPAPARLQPPPARSPAPAPARSPAAALPASPAAPRPAPCPPGSTAGPLTLLATAERTPAGWVVTDERGVTRRLPAAAQPAEWLDVTPRQPHDGALELFFATRQFALGTATRHWIDRHTWVGTIELGGALLESTTDLGDDDRPRLTVDSSGVVATRISLSDAGAAPDATLGADAALAVLAAPLDLVDLVELTTVPIRGGYGPASPFDTRRLRFTLPGDPNAPPPLPPPAPGQRILAEQGGWKVELTGQPDSPFSSGERTVVLAMEAIAQHLASQASQASRADGSDCTTLALRFAAAARRHRWKLRIATGFLVDGATLVRHRWIVAWTGARWITVDPSSGDAPAPNHLLGLALHDATAEGLAAAEGAFRPVRGASVEWIP